MHRLAILCAVFCLLVIPAGSAGAREQPVMVTASLQATAVVVLKSERRLVLQRHGQEIAAYNIALGPKPKGHKRRRGDGRTPEGRYTIDWRNPESAFHLSLHISYPAPRDQAAAAEAGRDPGGMIMIHGLPNGKDWIGSAHSSIDWTEGCIAVTSEEIEEIWSLVPDGTPIDIYP